MSFQIKSFTTMRISARDVTESKNWYQSLFGQKPIEQIGGKIYRGPLRVNEIQRTIVQIQDPFGNVIGFEAPFLDKI